MEEILCADCDKYVMEHNVIVWNPGEIGKVRSEGRRVFVMFLINLILVLFVGFELARSIWQADKPAVKSVNDSLLSGL